MTVTGWDQAGRIVNKNFPLETEHFDPPLKTQPPESCFDRPGKPFLFSRATCFEIHMPAAAPLPSHEQLSRSKEDFERWCGLKMEVENMPEWERALGDDALQLGLRLSVECPPGYAVQAAAMLAQMWPSETVVHYNPIAERLVFCHVNESALRRKAEEGLDVIK